jgi:hypothetical protein
MGKIEQTELVVESVDRLTRAVVKLGLNDAWTKMGAIEMLAMEVKNGTEAIADGLNNLARAIDDLEGTIGAAQQQIVKEPSKDG